MPRIFLLSPANAGGRRAQLVSRDGPSSALAQALRTSAGAPIGEVFAYLSGLYFRGKLAYARAFARPPDGVPGALVITPTRGLVPAATPIRLADLAEFASVDIRADDPRYAEPLARSAAQLARAAGACEFVLLGSIASGKYVEVLSHHVALSFPSDFVGRGDMSRGGLMLRAVEAEQELPVIPVAGAVRHGPRPERLAPVKGILRRTVLGSRVRG